MTKSKVLKADFVGLFDNASGLDFVNGILDDMPTDFKTKELDEGNVLLSTVFWRSSKRVADMTLQYSVEKVSHVSKSTQLLLKTVSTVTFVEIVPSGSIISKVGKYVVETDYSKHNILHTSLSSAVAVGLAVGASTVPFAAAVTLIFN